MILKGVAEEEAAPCESEASCELNPIEPTKPEVWEEPVEKDLKSCENEVSCELKPLEPTSPEVWDELEE